jgi:hypothetical protein
METWILYFHHFLPFKQHKCKKGEKINKRIIKKEERDRNKLVNEIVGEI